MLTAKPCKLEENVDNYLLKNKNRIKNNKKNKIIHHWIALKK